MDLSSALSLQSGACMRPSTSGAKASRRNSGSEAVIQTMFVTGAGQKLLDVVCDDCHAACHYGPDAVRRSVSRPEYSTSINEPRIRLTPARMTMSRPHLEVPKSCCRTLVTSHRRMQMVKPAQKARLPVRLRGGTCF